MTIISRTLAAIDAFRTPVAEPLRLEAKAAPVLPTSGGSYSTALSDWIAPRTSRVDYTQTDALLSSIVMACVNSVTRVFPEARLRVMRRGKDGAEEVEGHPLSRLAAAPNEFMSADEFWASTLCDYLVHGNAYWLKIRDGGRRVAELFPLPAALVRARWPKDGSEWISRYELWTPAGWTGLATEDVVHHRNGLDWSAGSDGRYGLSPLASVRREMYTDEEAGNYSAAMLRNLGVVGAVFTPKQAISMTDDHKRAWIAAYQQAYGGDNRGRPLVFEIPMDVSKIAFSAEDMTLDALRAKAEERISALLNVPAVVAGLGAGLEASGAKANFAEAYRQLWSVNIVPTQRAMARKVDAQLLPDFGRADGLSCSFDLSQVEALQESRETAEKRAGDAFERGALTLNEYRERLGEGPIPEGDVFFVPTTAMPTAAEALVAESDEPAEVPAPLQLVGAKALPEGFVAGYLAAKAEESTPSADDWPEVRRVLETLEVDGLLERFDGEAR